MLGRFQSDLPTNMSVSQNYKFMFGGRFCQFHRKMRVGTIKNPIRWVLLTPINGGSIPSPVDIAATANPNIPSTTNIIPMR